MSSATRRDRHKTDRYHEKREHIVEVAVELFSRNGYAATGVADIGEAAGLARGALYYYIGSKEELLGAIHDKVLDPLLVEGSAVVALDLSFPARLQLISESLLRQIIHRPDHVRVFLHDHRHLEGERREHFREKRARFEGQIRRILQDGAILGQIDVEDLELATLAFLNLHNYTYQWVGRRELIVTDLAEFYCRLFLHGVATGEDRAVDIDEEVDFGRSVLAVLRERGLDH
ncbi:TetR/AcrR family transcriptional regulator [Gordonia insulae]|uniref:HTH-type transcriptional repressor KstR2 n=1 Tax=Gordonia insulae TaxID=2420509 RepID=A0A3G8JLQ9_9ACTN|nr:TetR/AcrR family transcriptional regulator [Gordonia insulae]AZG45943.1 HTH-type transcriptional repressor KstR2 [Gordonia insulae]